MKTTYLVWKSPTCSIANHDYQEITGKEFYTLVRSAERENRYFIRLPSTISDGSDGAIVMETTKTDYLNWKREKNHADYLRNFDKDIEVISYHAMESDGGECFGEDLLHDTGCNVETDFFALFDRKEVRAAVSCLGKDEQQIVDYFYLSSKQGSERDYAKLTGISKTTVNRRKTAVLEKLKKCLSD